MCCVILPSVLLGILTFKHIKYTLGCLLLICYLLSWYKILVQFDVLCPTETTCLDYSYELHKTSFVLKPVKV